MNQWGPVPMGPSLMVPPQMAPPQGGMYDNQLVFIERECISMNKIME